MATQTFKRNEKKYIITSNQKDLLLEKIKAYFEVDKYCTNGSFYLVRNVYYDTNDSLLISKSLQKPKFKEKVRVRKYGYYNDNKDEYFLEIKRKFNGIVYKRRLALSKNELDNLINKKSIPTRLEGIDLQVAKELLYIFSIYNLKPKVFLSYERKSLFCREDPSFRLTLDRNLISRINDLDFNSNAIETKLIDDDCYLLEIKVSNTIPLWFSTILNSLKIYSSSFSKYGKQHEFAIGGK